MIVASSPYLDGTQPGKYSVEIKRALSNAATALQAERARLEKLEEVARMDTWESLVCALAILRPDPPVIAVSLGEAGRGEGLPVCPSAQHLHEVLLVWNEAFGQRCLHFSAQKQPTVLLH